MEKLIGISIFVFILWTKCIECSPLVPANVRDYDRKVCTNEPTCHLLKTDTYISETRSTINKRNCMCDPSCVEYRDCCSDAVYYNAENQNHHNNFSCPSSIKVYVKANCPQTWSDEAIQISCEKSSSIEGNNDTYLHIPVTDLATNITYANKYCAACHGVHEYQFWTGKPSCGEIDDNYLSEEGSLRSDIKFSIDYYKYAKKAQTIWQFVEFDTNSGQFISHYDHKLFLCQLTATLPSELKHYVRTCIPNVVETCEASTDVELEQKCKSRTALVYLKKNSKIVYRNLECARCNGISTSDVTGCPITLKD